MYLSTRDVADVLGFTTAVVRRWRENGLIKTTPVPTPTGRQRYYVHRDDLLKFASSMKLSPKIIAKIKELEE